MDSLTTAVIHDVIQKFFKDYTVIAITHNIKSAVRKHRFEAHKELIY
jgi:ABC-type phosphate transport system ATPase subunit